MCAYTCRYVDSNRIYVNISIQASVWLKSNLSTYLVWWRVNSFLHSSWFTISSSKFTTSAAGRQLTDKTDRQTVACWCVYAFMYKLGLRGEDRRRRGRKGRAATVVCSIGEKRELYIGVYGTSRIISGIDICWNRRHSNVIPIYCTYYRITILLYYLRTLLT